MTQSVTFVDVHCPRRTTLPRNGNVRRDSDDVFIWEHVGLLLVLLNGELRQILCVITASQTKDGDAEQNPSWMGTVCDRLSPESITMSVVRLEAYRNKTVGRGKRQSDVAIKVGAVDLGGRPPGSTPRSLRHGGGNTHLSRNTYSFYKHHFTDNI